MSNDLYRELRQEPSAPPGLPEVFQVPVAAEPETPESLYATLRKAQRPPGPWRDEYVGLPSRQDLEFAEDPTKDPERWQDRWRMQFKGGAISMAENTRTALMAAAADAAPAMSHLALASPSRYGQEVGLTSEAVQRLQDPEVQRQVEESQWQAVADQIAKSSATIDRYTLRDPNFMEKVVNGFGSLAGFLGVGALATLVAGPQGGAVIMAVAEAGGEQGAVIAELVQKYGFSTEEAYHASLPVFAANVPLNALLNIGGRRALKRFSGALDEGFSQKLAAAAGNPAAIAGLIAARMGREMTEEGVQEGLQEYISGGGLAHATGTPLSEHVTPGSALEATAIGAVTIGPVSAVSTGAGAVQGVSQRHELSAEDTGKVVEAVAKDAPKGAEIGELDPETGEIEFADGPGTRPIGPKPKGLAVDVVPLDDGGWGVQFRNADGEVASAVFGTEIDAQEAADRFMQGEIKTLAEATVGQTPAEAPDVPSQEGKPDEEPGDQGTLLRPGMTEEQALLEEPRVPREIDTDTETDQQIIDEVASREGWGTAPKAVAGNLSKAAAKISKTLGLRVVFVEDTNQFDGAYLGRNREAPDNLVLINARTKAPMNRVVAHESAHWMAAKMPNLYARVREVLAEEIKDNKAYQAYLKENYTDQYEAQGFAVPEDLSEEFVGDILGEMLDNPAMARRFFTDVSSNTFTRPFVSFVEHVREMVTRIKAALKGDKLDTKLQAYVKDLDRLEAHLRVLAGTAKLKNRVEGAGQALYNEERGPQDERKQGQRSEEGQRTDPGAAPPPRRNRRGLWSERGGRSRDRGRLRVLASRLTDLVDHDVVVDRSFDASPELVDLLTRIGANAESTILEISSDPDAFHSLISAGAAAHPAGAAVEVKEPGAYRDGGYRLFVDMSGAFGLALSPDGDIVSVFSNPTLVDGRSGVTAQLLHLAVSLGGRKLDCFDIGLPRLYGYSGFHAVAKLPWSDEFAPEGWDYDYFSKWKKGRPDVVLMVFNADNPDDALAGYGEYPRYRRDYGKDMGYSPDWDSAAVLQDAPPVGTTRLMPMKPGIVEDVARRHAESHDRVLRPATSLAEKGTVAWDAFKEAFDTDMWKLHKLYRKYIKTSGAPRGSMDFWGMALKARAVQSVSDSFLHSGVRRYGDGEKVSMGITDIIKKWLRKREDVSVCSAYLINKRIEADDLAGKEIDPEILAEAQEYVKAIEDDPDQKDIIAAAGEMHKLLDESLNYMRDAGILTDAQVAKIRRLDEDGKPKAGSGAYVPLFRLEDPTVQRIATKAHLQTGGLPKYARGIKAGTEFLDPFIATRMVVATRVKAVFWNDVRRGLWDAAGKDKSLGIERARPKMLTTKASGDELLHLALGDLFNDAGVQLDEDTLAEGLVTMLEESGGAEYTASEVKSLLKQYKTIYRINRMDPGTNIISFIEDGKVAYLKVPPELWDMFSTLMTQRTSKLARGVGKVTATFRTMTTFTLDFIVKNMIRDVQESLVSGEVAPTPKYFQQYYRSIIAVATGNKDYQKWLAAGAGMGHPLALYTEEYSRRMTAIMSNEWRLRGGAFVAKVASRIKREGLDSKGYKVLFPDGVHTIRELAEGAVSRSDAISRIPQYLIRLEHHKKKVGKGYTERDAMMDAATDARWPSLDFLKAGSWGREINHYVPFFNARMRGMGVSLNALKKPRTAMRAAWVYIIPTMLYWALVNDEEWYQEVPDWLKATCYVIPVGDHYICVPRGQTLGLLFGGGTELALNLFKKTDNQSAAAWAEQIRKELDFVDIPVPAIKAVAEIGMNKDSWSGMDIVPERLRDADARYQVGRRTPAFFAWAASTPAGQLIRLSPAKTEHFIKATLSTVGKGAMDVADMAYRASSKELRGRSPKGPSWLNILTGGVRGVVPLVREAKNGRTRNTQRIMKEFDKAQAAKVSLVQQMQWSKEGLYGHDKKTMRAFIGDKFDELATYQAYQEAAHTMIGMWGMARHVEDAPASVWSRDEKREALREWHDGMNLYAREVHYGIQEKLGEMTDAERAKIIDEYMTQYEKMPPPDEALEKLKGELPKFMKKLKEGFDG